MLMSLVRHSCGHAHMPRFKFKFSRLVFASDKKIKVALRF